MTVTWGIPRTELHLHDASTVIKIAFSLGEAASEKLSTEVVEAASVLTDFEHGMKQIEGEFMILQAFIGQVSAQNVGDRTFDAWLDQVRDVARQVEDIIDEYTFLTSQAAAIDGFFKRKFHQAKSFAAWRDLSSQIDQVETRIQRLTTMKDRYGISVGEPGRSSTLQYARQLSLSDSSYLSDDTELVGNANEIRWFPKLSSLALVDMDRLNSIEIEEGTMKVLHTLEIVGLKSLKVVPRGIKHIKTLQKMLLTDMRKEFMDRLQGDDSDIVEHIPDIQSFDSFNSEAVKKMVLLPHLAKKYGTGWWELC
ncbi:hypothetical protein ZWY2020_001714 [Hordeum vulgare]|nr:hypothetical protein ZWY2020_001714 [Hordeum vulgare]